MKRTQILNGNKKETSTKTLTDKAMFIDLEDHINMDGGFTYDCMNNMHKKTGYAVSLHGREQRINNFSKLSANTVRKELAQYTLSHPSLYFQNNTPIYFGAWIDRENNQLVLDTSIITNSLKQARAIANSNGQKYIYSLDLSRSIKMPY